MMSDAPPSSETASRSAVLDSFESFYRREHESIVRIAWSLTGLRSVAEELAQEAFLEAHRIWQRLQAYDNPGAWLRRVTINRSLSVLRRGAVESRGLSRLKQVRETDVVLPESTDEVWQALRTLPRRQIEVLVLVVVEDRSVADVARILGCGEQTVRTHLRRGRIKLAELLGVDEEVADDLA